MKKKVLLYVFISACVAVLSGCRKENVYVPEVSRAMTISKERMKELKKGEPDYKSMLGFEKSESGNYSVALIRQNENVGEKSLIVLLYDERSQRMLAYYNLPLDYYSWAAFYKNKSVDVLAVYYDPSEGAERDIFDSIIIPVSKGIVTTKVKGTERVPVPGINGQRFRDRNTYRGGSELYVIGRSESKVEREGESGYWLNVFGGIEGWISEYDVELEAEEIEALDVVPFDSEKIFNAYPPDSVFGVPFSAYYPDGSADCAYYDSRRYPQVPVHEKPFEDSEILWYITYENSCNESKVIRYFYISGATLGNSISERWFETYQSGHRGFVSGKYLHSVLEG